MNIDDLTKSINVENYEPFVAISKFLVDSGISEEEAITITGYCVVQVTQRVALKLNKDGTLKQIKIPENLSHEESLAEFKLQIEKLTGKEYEKILKNEAQKLLEELKEA